MDSAVKIPGTEISFGLDGIIGLIPGIGDSIGALISSYIIFRARQAGVPRLIISRMVINVVVDTLVGAVPILGDLFDFTWKSNERNVALVRRYSSAPQKVQRSSFALIVVLIALFSLTLIGSLWMIAYIYKSI